MGWCHGWASFAEIAKIVDRGVVIVERGSLYGGRASGYFAPYIYAKKWLYNVDNMLIFLKIKKYSSRIPVKVT